MMFLPCCGAMPPPSVAAVCRHTDDEPAGSYRWVTLVASVSFPVERTVCTATRVTGTTSTPARSKSDAPSHRVEVRSPFQTRGDAFRHARTDDFHTSARSLRFGAGRSDLSGAVVTPAQHLVTNRGGHRFPVGRGRPRNTFGVGDHDGRSLPGQPAVDHPAVEPAGPPAPAEHLDLDGRHLVGDLEEPRRAGEQDAAEVGGDAERVDVDGQFVGDQAELVDL